MSSEPNQAPVSKEKLPEGKGRAVYKKLGGVGKVFRIVRYGAKRLQHPLVITTPNELAQFIDHHTRLLIRRCINTKYRLHHSPPVDSYLTINLLLWQHSLLCWQELVSKSDYIKLSQRIEGYWQKQCRRLPNNNLNFQQQELLRLQLRSSFYTSNNPSFSKLSEELYQYLSPQLMPFVTLGFLRFCCDGYFDEWQERVSSRNIIGILLVDK